MQDNNDLHNKDLDFTEHKELIFSLLNDSRAPLNIYVDDPNGIYESKAIYGETPTIDYIDVIKTDGKYSHKSLKDGNFEVNPNSLSSLAIEDAEYTVIQTYSNKEVTNNTLIMSPAVYGFISAELLRNGDMTLAKKLTHNTKGTLEKYKPLSKSSYLSIVPKKPSREQVNDDLDDILKDLTPSGCLEYFSDKTRR